MTEHPFTNLPEGAVVSFPLPDCFTIRINALFVDVAVSYGQWGAAVRGITQFGPTPDAAFQALRQAVKELANDLGVG